MTLRSVRNFILTYSMLTTGAIMMAFGVIIFLAPNNIAPSGVSGIGVILNKQIGTPIGLVVLVLNIPIQIGAYFFLPGGWRTIFRTGITIAIYTFALDFLVPVLPATGVSDNELLNAIFGGVVGGIGSGIVIRAGGNFGGTSTVALIIQRRTGIPLSTLYLYVDALVIGIAGLIFGWEAALLAVVTLFIDGTATNYILEGPSVIRTAVIVTDKPDAISQQILSKMDRGVTGWEARGMYTGQTRHVLYVSVARSQVQELRRRVQESDPDAFMVVGQGQAAYGEGFQKRIAPCLDLSVEALPE